MHAALSALILTVWYGGRLNNAQRSHLQPVRIRKDKTRIQVSFKTSEQSTDKPDGNNTQTKRELAIRSRNQNQKKLPSIRSSQIANERKKENA